MFGLLLIAALAIVPQDCVARDGVDVLEVHHLYSDEGQHVFTQVIGWQADRVRFWRMAKTADMLPVADPIQGGYVLRWIDNDTTREVRSSGISERWTQYDVETHDRTILPAEQRRKLKGPK